jgi:sRNA-binding protein
VGWIFCLAGFPEDSAHDVNSGDKRSAPKFRHTMASETRRHGGGIGGVPVLSNGLGRSRHSPMPSTYQIERNRGTKDFRRQLAVLREKWPHAFPDNHREVRPLAIGAAGEIAAAMGWSLPYTLGVLVCWKMAPVYCEAVLCYDRRVALDGSSAEPIDDQARDLATKRLARLAALEAAKTATKAAPAVVKPKPTPAPRTERPRETRDQLRGRVRASLLHRRT